MPKKLTDINITHISLVKAGANGKEFIYKSAKDPGGYEHVIDIRKTDEEQGIVYGIVYAPDQVDSQGDFAEAGDIQKAAYAFMKARNTNNVDQDHSFQNEDAFVAESWIVKGGDPIFGEEPEGSWAVAIKLESEELKKSAREGDLKGLSMAGAAQKTEVEKAGEGDSKFKSLMNAIADVIPGFWMEFGTYIEKSKQGDVDMGEKIKDFGADIKKKLQEATKPVSDAIEKAAKEQEEKIEKLQESVAATVEKVNELTKANEEIVQANETLTTENQELKKEIEEQKAKIETLEKKTDETEETLKKSKQQNTTKSKTTTQNKGVM